MGKAARRDLVERLRTVEAMRALDAQEYCCSLAAAETRLEEQRARRVRTEVDLANQEMGCQAMERALDGNFPRIPFL